MIVTLVQANLQQALTQTPDTVRYMAAGYTAIGTILLGYILFLWSRSRRLK